MSLQDAPGAPRGGIGLGSGRCRALAATGLLAAWGAFAAPTPALAGVDVPGEIQCLALTMYFEARGEPDTGKIAVGHVVMNRVAHPLFPRRVCDVARQGGDKLRYRCQFTWWCDGLSDMPRDRHVWRRVKALARRVYWEASEDPTGGALWYHAISVMPQWRLKLSAGPIIGNHIFYRLAPGDGKSLSLKGAKTSTRMDGETSTRDGARQSRVTGAPMPRMVPGPPRRP